MLAKVHFTDVRIEDEFWSPRRDINSQRTLPHCMKWCVDTGRLANFERAAAGQTSGHEGWFFNDSDIYKVIEGAANILAHQRDEQLEAQIDDWISKIVAAQRDDGYLNTYFQLNPTLEPWTQDQFHELYCLGALCEAGIAYHQATGKRALLDTAIKLADNADAVFGPSKRPQAPEHPEVELALIKLWRATGTDRYLALAAFFLEQRGRHENRTSWKEYAQDHLPIREQSELVGHGVRAMYLYAALTDMAGVNGDEGYIQALHRLWNDLVTRKLYVTGGLGVWQYDEGFAAPFHLPNEQAYAESCASIGLAFWSHRLALLHHDARFIDTLERVLYNSMPAGVSLDGQKFLYANPLASRGPDSFQSAGVAQGQSRSHRQEWFRCACCPPNILRFLAELGSYIYAHSDNAVYVNLYIAGQAEFDLGGSRLAITQDGHYPWDGHVEFTIQPPTATHFDLFLRLPDWCAAPRLTLNGKPIQPDDTARGYAQLAREWQPGDVVALDLPMPVQRIQAAPHLHENAGRITLQRGPIVYALETADNPDGVWNIALPHDADITAEHRADLLGGVTVLSGPALRRGPDDDHRLYRPATSQPPSTSPATFTAIPYAVWDNRDPGEMVVWLPEDPTLAEPSPE